MKKHLDDDYQWRQAIEALRIEVSSMELSTKAWSAPSEATREKAKEQLIQLANQIIMLKETI